MSPEEYAFKIAELIKECYEETGFRLESGELYLTKWSNETGMYENVDIPI